MEPEILGDISYQAPNLDIPDPPRDLPYAQLEDYRNREILKANGIAITEESLITALDTQTDILQACVAHTIGSAGVRAAAPALQRTLNTPDDQVQVEVAYALARLGDAAGRSALAESLRHPLEAYLSPLLAAGYLAQLNDPRGFPIVTRALAMDLLAPKMLACKQLFFFMPFHGARDDAGQPIDVAAQFQRALRDSNTNIQWQALVQMRELRSPHFRPILTAYLQQASDDHLADVARGILGSLG